MLRYAITDSRRSAQPLQARRAALLQQAARLAAGGIDMLQLREKDLPPRELLSLARDLKQTLTQYAADSANRTRLLIHSRTDVSLAAEADGVHLTSAPGELSPAQVRSLFRSAGRPAPIVSVSCHTVGEVQRAIGDVRNAAPDLILFGPVFEKVIATIGAQSVAALTRVADGTGLALLVQACALAAPTPVLALGGITPENIPACLSAGAQGVAAIRLFSSPGSSATPRRATIRR